MADKLFNSYSEPIPPIRYDIQRISINEDGQSLIYFYDQLGYATSDFALPADAEPILSLMDETRSVNDIIKFSSDEVSKEQILEYAQFLDGHRLLDSAFFHDFSDRLEDEYELLKIHSSSTAGTSYPNNHKELTEFFNHAFATHEQSKPVDAAKGLYTPHIDLRVGMETYVKAFSSIKNLTPKKVFVLATSHYSGLYRDFYDNKRFIFSTKDFDLVNGLIKADRKAISLIKEQTVHDEIFGSTFNDRAHRIEHSIELPLLFLNHIWSHDFEIIPVVISGFDELFYTKDGFLAHQIEAFSYLLSKQFNGDDTFFLISGDLAHFGKKFGDSDPASNMIGNVRAFDDVFLKVAAKNDTLQLLRIIGDKYDPFRICGFPPLYTFMNAFPHLKGEILHHQIWDEIERESAVSFGSIVFS